MLSHSVPRKLLEQFAYFHTPTQSLRLWRYEKNKSPYPKAAPKSATTFEHYFEHPHKPTLEEETERAIAQKIEDPVHRFLCELRDPDFRMNPQQREAMTRYISLLFSRSRARREGSKHVQELIGIALQLFLANESQILTVAAQWSLEQTFKGNPMWVGTRYVERIAKRLLEPSRTSSSEQANFVVAIQASLNRLDGAMLQGQWNLLKTEPDNPFILSDSPVITWERLADGQLSYGDRLSTSRCRSDFASFAHNMFTRLPAGATRAPNRATNDGGDKPSPSVFCIRCLLRG